MLLGFVPDLDYILGSIIVDAICHEQFKSFDELLKNPKVSPEIKNLIRKAKYVRERTRGGKAWPEFICSPPEHVLTVKSKLLPYYFVIGIVSDRLS